MGTSNKISAIVFISILSPLTFCGAALAQRSLAFAQDTTTLANNEIVTAQTQAALALISKGSEEFALDLFKVSQIIHAGSSREPYDLLILILFWFFSVCPMR